MRRRALKLGVVVMGMAAAMFFSGCKFGGFFGYGRDSAYSNSDSVVEKMSAPTVTQVGNILTWEDVENATEYLVKFGSQSVYTAKTSCYLENYEEGGSFTVQAVRRENDEIVQSSPASLEIDFPQIVYNEDNSVVYDFRTESVADISIPATVRKCTVYGGGEYKNFSIIVKERTMPLIVELYDVKANYFGIEGEVRSDVPTTQLVTVKSLGEVGNEFKGVNGNPGSKGITGGGWLNVGGDGTNGGVGGDGGRFNNVLITGTQNITFTGGQGGNGGDGGKPGFGQAIYGDGGNGGDGGVGLRTANCFVYMEYATLLTTGGEGGNGGYRAAWLIGSEGNGYKGNVGTEFIGEKTVFAKPLVMMSEHLQVPTVTQIGNILTWEDVENATEYLVKFGSQSVYTKKTSCYLENYEEGGSFTVQALRRVNDEIIQSSPASLEIDFPQIVYNEENSVVYDFRTESVTHVFIPATVRKCTVYGGGEYKNFSIIIKERTTPLIVELYDVKANYFGIAGEVQSDAPTTQLVTIKSLGEVGNEFKGFTGVVGQNAAELEQKDGTGGQGGDGGRFNNVLITGTQNITFTGGQGGKGGDGANGGDGGVGLRTASCFVYMEYATLLTTGGEGGNGAGTADPGSVGGIGTEFIGEKTVFAEMLIITSQE